MKEHLYGLAKDDYVAFITEYVRRTVGQYGPAPADDVQHKLVCGGHMKRRSCQLRDQFHCYGRSLVPSTPRRTPEESLLLMLTGVFVSLQAALQLSTEQALAVAELTRTMIGQLSALSQRFKALDDVEESASASDSPLQHSEGRRQDPAAASSTNDLRGPALKRRSPELAAMRVKSALDAGLIPRIHMNAAAGRPYARH